ncbi:MAG: cytochrome c3 family protein [Bacillota bacterium]
MKKGLLIFLLVSAFILMLSIPAYAALPAKVSVDVEETSPAGSNSNVTFTFNATATAGTGSGFTLEYTSDGGATWTAAAQDTTVAAPNYKFTATLVDFKLYYVRIKDKLATGYKYMDVLPPNNHGHANYSDNTDMCKGCHITHNATQAKLLKGTDTKSLCYTCHATNTTTGSRYDVQQGRVILANATFDPATLKYDVTTATWGKTLGGPFGTETSPRLPDQNLWGASTTVTSRHDIEGTVSLIPGSTKGSPNAGNLNGSFGGGTFTCVSCHNGHDNDGNYRILKAKAWSTDTAVLVRAFPKTDTTGETAKYVSGFTGFCGLCHDKFNVGAGSGRGTQPVYRHAMDVPLTNYFYTNGTLTTSLPLESGDPAYASPQLVCVSCHYAHGTVVTGTNPTYEGAAGGTDNSTMLKRLPNMQVCEDCHKK